jgi:hypothetical protein
MTVDDSEFVKKEAFFFMERVYQTSYLYVASLFALGIASKAEVSSPVVEFLGGEATTAVALALLVLNWSYLLVVISAMYSVLKRGLFLVTYCETQSIYSRWEAFLRSPPREVHDLAWNTDNYFVGVVACLVLISSALAVTVGLAKGHYAVFVPIAAAYSIPLWAGAKLRELERVLKTAASEFEKKSTSASEKDLAPRK